jgi:BirA family biotin operon repressor/biotin-[acetyl-CoA-carboxylase] ligase
MLRDAGDLSADWSGLVTAEQQTAGRGRQGRSWFAAERAFMGTFLFCTDRPLAALTGYSLAVGLAVLSAFDPFGLPLSLKWPNDLVVARGGEMKKLGGILIEVEEMGALRCILVGLGINISQPPEAVSDIATSLESVGRQAFPLPVVTEALSRELLVGHRWFLRDGGLREILDRWQERSCFTRGQTEVSVEVGDSLVRGVYSGVSETGALVLVVDGAERTIHSGHIVQTRL